MIRDTASLVLRGAAIAAVVVAGNSPNAIWCAAGAGIAGFALARTLPAQRRAATLILVFTALALGAFAVGVSPLVSPWQIPHVWADLVRFSTAGGGFAAATYVIGLSLLLRTPFPPGLRQLCALGAIPYSFNTLLLLASPTLLDRIAQAASVGLTAPGELTGWLGRFSALVALTGGLALGVGWAMDGRGLRHGRAWATLVLCAGGAALAPWAATLGSSAWLDGRTWPWRLAGTLAAAMLAHAGLWAQTFVATGVVLDALRYRRPTAQALWVHARRGAIAGAKFAALFMLLMHLLAYTASAEALRAAIAAAPIVVGAVSGTLLFGVAQTVIETFDASPAFTSRLLDHWRNPNSLARGLVSGAALGLAIALALPTIDDGPRAWFGFAAGAVTYAGVDLARHVALILARQRGRFEGARVYGAKALVGGFVGAALAWYFDRAQCVEVGTRLLRFGTLNFAAAGGTDFTMVVYPLFSKWGAIDLGPVGGGVKLFYDQSLAGVINWALAAPLFSLNLCALNALLSRSTLPLRRVWTREGLTDLADQTVRVLRWGLWMAPIIFAFLKVAPDPTWYNQDGALRTLLAGWHQTFTTPTAFAAWSRDLFLGLLAYDWLRCLIWFDHMGLRVATLVNLSFVGIDHLERRLGRYIGYGSGARILPEGLRRFFTWAPLLIPFYLPRGGDWDYVWQGAERLHAASTPLLAPASTLLTVYAAAAIVGLGLVLALRGGARTRRDRVPAAPPGIALPYRLGNGLLTVHLAADGRGFCEVARVADAPRIIDLIRRPLHPCDARGPWFFLHEPDTGRTTRLEAFAVSRPGADRLLFAWHDSRWRVAIELTTDRVAPLLFWRIRLTNLSADTRQVALVSSREFALNVADVAERQPAFNQIHIGTEFVPSARALIAHNRLLRPSPRAGGYDVAIHALLTADPEFSLMGYQDARALLHDALDARDAVAHFRKPDDTGLAYTFEPVGALCVAGTLAPATPRELCFVDGYAADRAAALRALGCASASPPPAAATRTLHPRAAADYGFSADGREFECGLTTPRPWTHVLANARGYGALLSNVGDHCSFAVNAQQHMLTPFTCDTVAPAAPGRAIYVCDLASGRIDSAGYAPCRQPDSHYRTHFGLGYAVQRCSSAMLDLEVTHFVVDDAPLEIALVHLRNRSPTARRYRCVPYAELLLAEIRQGSHGLLDVVSGPSPQALCFRNRHNGYAQGWGFIAASETPPYWETVAACFRGVDGSLARPAFVATGRGDSPALDDGYRIAACALEFDVPAGASASFAVLLGFARDPAEVATLVSRFGSVAQAERALADTRAAWQDRLSVLRITSEDPGFDRLVNDWLPYQALTSRLWGRLGPDQRSGAFGFRDQLQDVLPFTALAPALARAQVLLHASQQFGAGDALKWWHPAPDGATSLGARTRASDPHLWLPYVTSAYVAATGDAAILDEQIPFIVGRPVPRGAEGYGFVPRRSRDRASLFEHCRRAIDYTLARRSPRGLPLIGTGDWNDGFDRLGPAGRGESGWLALFLVPILRDFATLAARRNDATLAARWREEADSLTAALSATRVAGGYLRASDDAGRPLVITDALMGAWPALSGAVSPADAAQALHTALTALEQDTLVCILQPALTAASVPSPGRIADYPPGVRENGGQYSHGVSWLIDAACALAESANAAGDGPAADAEWQTAARLWRKISPLDWTPPARCAAYGLPPYQQAADVYFGPGYAGRGGWTAYTGAAARMLWAAYRLCGLRFEGGTAHLVAPPNTIWPRVTRVEYRGQTLTPLPASADLPQG